MLNDLGWLQLVPMSTIVYCITARPLTIWTDCHASPLPSVSSMCACYFTSCAFNLSSSPWWFYLCCSIPKPKLSASPSHSHQHDHVTCVRRWLHQATCGLWGSLQGLEALRECTCLQPILHQVRFAQRVLGDNGAMCGLPSSTAAQQCSTAINSVRRKCS